MIPFRPKSNPYLSLNLEIFKEAAPTTKETTNRSRKLAGVANWMGKHVACGVFVVMAALLACDLHINIRYCRK
jgi:hypothetical protein